MIFLELPHHEVSDASNTHSSLDQSVSLDTSIDTTAEPTTYNTSTPVVDLSKDFVDGNER